MPPPLKRWLYGGHDRSAATLCGGALSRLCRRLSPGRLAAVRPAGVAAWFVAWFRRMSPSACRGLPSRASSMFLQVRPWKTSAGGQCRHAGHHRSRICSIIFSLLDRRLSARDVSRPTRIPMTFYFTHTHNPTPRAQA